MPPSLAEWMDTHSASLFLSAVTVAEIEDGIAKSRREGATRKSADRAAWLETLLHLYDDRGGVQAPQSYALEYWDGSAWKPVGNETRSPEKPAGGQFNEAAFDPVMASKVRVVFTHRGKARSGVSEVFVWAE